MYQIASHCNNLEYEGVHYHNVCKGVDGCHLLEERPWKRGIQSIKQFRRTNGSPLCASYLVQCRVPCRWTKRCLERLLKVGLFDVGDVDPSHKMATYVRRALQRMHEPWVT